MKTLPQLQRSTRRRRTVLFRVRTSILSSDPADLSAMMTVGGLETVQDTATSPSENTPIKNPRSPGTVFADRYEVEIRDWPRRHGRRLQGG